MFYEKFQEIKGIFTKFRILDITLSHLNGTQMLLIFIDIRFNQVI